MMISHAADLDRPVGGITQRHIEGCESCRRFHESCQFLGDGLRAEAIDLNGAYSLSAERIKKALAGPSGRYRHIPIKLKYFAAAACIFLAAAAAVMLMSRPPEQHHPEDPPVSISDLLGTDLQANWAGLLEEPLAGEMKNLADDTESAIRFLVACVDVDPLRKDAVHERYR
jgi:hypothetical protein